jgi:hypothetical protein
MRLHQYVEKGVVGREEDSQLDRGGVALLVGHSELDGGIGGAADRVVAVNRDVR